MSVGRQGFITNHETYIYQEANDQASAAFGIDSQDNDLWKLKVSENVWAVPNGTAHVMIDPRTDGNITFTPNGTGRVVAETGITITTGGLTITNLAATLKGIMRIDDAGVLSALEDSSTAGQVLISSSSGQAAWASLTAGTNVTIIPGDNSIEISASGGSTGMTWSEVTGTTVSLAAENGYVMNNASRITATLPATCALGKRIAILGKGSGGWKIEQNSGQTIRFIALSTTTDVSGYLQSSEQYDCLEIVCITADTDFIVRSSSGNITII